MSFWKKHTLYLGAVLGSATLLLSCATYIHPGTTLYWSGKHINEYLASKGLTPTIKRMCKDNDKPFILYGFAKPTAHIVDREVGRSYNSYGGTTIYVQKERQYTGDYLWSYIFTDLDGKITSHRSDTWFGDVEKEFKCGGYEENLTHSATKNDKTAKTTDEKIPNMQSRVWMGVARVKGDERSIWTGNATHQYPQDAKDGAIKQCQQMTGEQCEFALGFSNACLSLAHGTHNGRSIDQFGVGVVAEQSKQLALTSCQKEGGLDCAVSAPWPICSTPCDPLTDDQCFFAEPQLAKPNKQGKNERISFTYEGGILPLK